MTHKIVILHGAWQGPWIWEGTATLLRKAGYDVLVPDILTHAQRDAPFDTAAAILGDMLGDASVTLVGHSMGALTAATAAPHLPGLSQVVFVDGSLVAAGTSLWDAFPAPQQEWLSGNTTDGKIAPPPPEAFGIDSQGAQGKWLARHLAPHDMAWFKTPVSHDLTGIPGAFVHCTNHPSPITQDSATRAEGWGMRRHPLAADHLPMVTHEAELAQMLTNLISDRA